MDIIAERRLTLMPTDGPEQPVVVRLGRPEQHAPGEWRVPYQIVGPLEDAKIRYAGGVDSMQALMLAIEIIPSFLESFKAHGRLTFLKNEETGFPPPIA